MPGPARYKHFAVNIEGRRRQGLANRDLALSAAKGQVTKALNSGQITLKGPGDGYLIGSRYRSESDKFKTGVVGMAVRAGTTEQYELIRRMDADKLHELYKKADIVFEVFFEYEGIEHKGGYATRSERNVKNTQFLIDQYTRAYGRP